VDENAALSQALTTVVFYKVNAEEGEGMELAKQFTVKGYPTFVVTNADGDTIERWADYENPESFMATLGASTADPTTIAEKRERFEREPTARDASVLGNYHMSREELEPAAEYFETAVELGDPADGLLYDLFIAYLWGHDTETFSSEELIQAADRAVESEYLTTRQRLELASYMSRALRKEQELSAAPYLEAALEVAREDNDPALEKLRRSVRIEHALRVAGDKTLALELKREGLKEGWDEDPDALNGFAWWCFENELNLEEAEALARQGVELAEDDTSKAMILDTVAEIVFVRGDGEGAVALIAEARELDPESEHYETQLARFNGEAVTEVADAD
jgi:tetratricopeptide (TPR) repeat protein